MKICHITSVHMSSDNRIYEKEVKTLANCGYQVAFVATKSDNFILDQKIEFHELKYTKNRFKRVIIKSFFSSLHKAIKTRASIYHFHDPELIPVGIVLKLLGKKVIYDAHENLGAAILSKPYLRNVYTRKIISKAAHLIEHTASRFFNAVITARPDISETFSHHNNVYTLRNFPKLSDLKQQATKNVHKSDKKSIIYVGGMTKIRGTLELIKAFESLNDFELWLLGPFASDSFRKECEQLAGWQNVKYFGSVKPYEIFSYIEKADAGIVTFLPAPNHMTTLATKPFEYMSCGKPMIMSHFPYWKDFFKNSSLYVDPADPKDISKQVQNLFSCMQTAQEMGNFNRSLIFNEYNWEEESKVLIEMYQNILKG